MSNSKRACLFYMGNDNKYYSYCSCMIEVMLIVSFVAYAHSQAKYEKDR